MADRDDMAKQLAQEIDSDVRTYFYKRFSERKPLPTDEEVEDRYRLTYKSKTLFPEFVDLDIDEDVFLGSLIIQYKQSRTHLKPAAFFYHDEESKPWINKQEVDGGYYWSRYCRYLVHDKHWSERTVASLDEDTNNILDCMADPKIEQSFDRRGLVVASVQSGKTANYIGLISKAADAGYRIIIVMAGIYNELRNQTQERIEEGFAGIDISKRRRYVGVGIDCNPRRFPILETSRTRDYNKSTADTNRGLLASQGKEPFVFVIKKNVNSLRGLTSWLQENCRHDEPMLLIDDEADNASINVQYRKNDVSRINGQIRTMLGIFNKHVYVGYTATPFANVLIDSRAVNNEVGADIFPKSFICTLEQSSDYFGAEKVFGDFDEENPTHLRYITDIDDMLPAKHRSIDEVAVLCESLKKAIRTFVISCAIRLLNGDADEHMSMMVNVSPYTNPQHDIRFLVKKYLDEIVNAVISYAALPSLIAEQSSSVILDLRKTWQEEYESSMNYSWDTILAELFEAVLPIKVVEVNSKSKDPFVYGEAPIRVIAIGGYRLSRGLTLEGLVISYYSRNTRAYDTLMQMARWFGYRHGYENLCRVWMTRDAAGWYSFVSDATEDLIDEVRAMRRGDSKPIEYGLRIQQNPNALEITSRSKIGAGQAVKEIPVRLDGKYIETRALLRAPSERSYNEQLSQQLATAIVNRSSQPIEPEQSGKRTIFRSVPMHYLADFISEFHNANDESPNSRSDYIIQHLQKLKDHDIFDCDILFIGGSLNDRPFKLLGNDIPRERRRPGSKTTSGIVYIGNKQMTASRGEEKNILEPQQINDAETQFLSEHPGKTNIPSSAYRAKLERPLLMIHMLSLGFQDANHADSELLLSGNWPDAKYFEDAVSWGISFPRMGITSPVNYVCNDVFFRQMKGFVEEEEEEMEAEDEPDE